MVHSQVTLYKSFVYDDAKLLCTELIFWASLCTGKERDAESGLDYFGARYYASSMGRFSSPDPSGLSFANMADPQSLNLYAYVQNNPLVFVDPTGLSKDCGGGGDPSVVCMVTTLWDKISNFFSGLGGGGGGCTGTCVGDAPSFSFGGMSGSGGRGGDGLQTRLPLADNLSNLRLFPTRVQPNNHQITYRLRTLDGKHLPRGRYYVFEHQTQGGGGRFQAGPGDYVSPSQEDFVNSFLDELGGGGLNTRQSFTVSQQKNYDPSAQYPMLIRYGNGQDYSSQGIWQPGPWDPVWINGMTQIPGLPDLTGEY